MLFWDTGGLSWLDPKPARSCQLGTGGEIYNLEAVMLYPEVHTSTFCKTFYTSRLFALVDNLAAKNIPKTCLSAPPREARSKLAFQCSLSSSSSFSQYYLSGTFNILLYDEKLGPGTIGPLDCSQQRFKSHGEWSQAPETTSQSALCRFLTVCLPGVNINCPPPC